MLHLLAAAGCAPLEIFLPQSEEKLRVPWLVLFLFWVAFGTRGWTMGSTPKVGHLQHSPPYSTPAKVFVASAAAQAAMHLATVI
jgi:hypothetical protein